MKILDTEWHRDKSHHSRCCPVPCFPRPQFQKELDSLLHAHPLTSSQSPANAGATMFSNNKKWRTRRTPTHIYTLHIWCRWRSGLKSQCSSRAKRLRFMSWLTEVSALSMWHLYTCNTMQYINQWETRRHDVYEYIWVYVIGVCKEVTTCRHTHTMPSNGMPCRAMSCHAKTNRQQKMSCRQAHSLRRPKRYTRTHPKTWMPAVAGS